MDLYFDVVMAPVAQIGTVRCCSSRCHDDTDDLDAGEGRRVGSI